MGVIDMAMTRRRPPEGDASALGLIRRLRGSVGRPTLRRRYGFPRRGWSEWSLAIAEDEIIHTLAVTLHDKAFRAKTPYEEDHSAGEALLDLAEAIMGAEVDACPPDFTRVPEGGKDAFLLRRLAGMSVDDALFCEWSGPSVLGPGHADVHSTMLDRTGLDPVGLPRGRLVTDVSHEDEFGRPWPTLRIDVERNVVILRPPDPMERIRIEVEAGRREGDTE